ncbi:recombination mediator RecR [Magnetospirillum sp. UT-4]|uniref:recombination mediator RecR n=1 Tax=Magnetospirillum sp. UT-4 TaxID=2681467 RepID=UPI00138266F8|nr:recombination mediator RecR [Magnetospirillum sp. UT-4]CAA7624367.1 gap repair protein [Magnetospirillum sp. UT-4]
MVGPELERLIQVLSRLPGLGPRSARRAALHLIERKDVLMRPLAEALASAADSVRRCPVCGNFDSVEPCAICSDPRRDDGLLCVVADVGSLWAMERTGAYAGRYHVLGGLLSALDGVGPEDLGIARLVTRAAAAREVILATPATVEGQTTAHYIADRLAGTGVAVSGLAHGVPVGGELDYLDDGTISAALRARRSL